MSKEIECKVPVTHHNNYYAKSILEHNNKRWREFTGMCFLYSLMMEDITVENIIDYIFETFHQQGIDEISNFFRHPDELKKDIELYFSKEKIKK